MADIILSGLTSPVGDARQMDLQTEGDPTVPFPIAFTKQGGIGFALEGGVIVVTASPDKINVSFDRPMIYNGDFTNNGPQDPFTIDQPALTSGSRSLDIPIITPPSADGIALLSVVGGQRIVTLTFSDNLVVSPAGQNISNWRISTSQIGAIAATISSLVVLDNQIILETSELTSSAIYTVHIPVDEIQDTNGDLYLNPASYDFIGFGTRPSVIGTRIVNDNAIDVIFNEDVQTETATNPLNYAFEPPLQVTRITRLSGSEYRLRVVGRRDSQTYTLTVTGVLDLANNPVVS